jgi:hypothetical protein
VLALAMAAYRSVVAASACGIVTKKVPNAIANMTAILLVLFMGDILCW